MPISSWRGGGSHFAHSTPEAHTTYCTAHRIRHFFLPRGHLVAAGERGANGAAAWLGKAHDSIGQRSSRSGAGPRVPSGWIHTTAAGPHRCLRTSSSQKLEGRAGQSCCSSSNQIRPICIRAKNEKWGCSITSLSTTCKVPPQMHLYRNASLCSFSSIPLHCAVQWRGKVLY